MLGKYHLTLPDTMFRVFGSGSGSEASNQIIDCIFQTMVVVLFDQIHASYINVI